MASSQLVRFVITEKAPTRAFSWLKVATSAFTFKTLLRHYAKRVFTPTVSQRLLPLSHLRHHAKRAFTPRSLNVKLGSRCNYHEGRAAIRHYANQPARPL